MYSVYANVNGVVKHVLLPDDIDNDADAKAEGAKQLGVDPEQVVWVFDHDLLDRGY